MRLLPKPSGCTAAILRSKTPTRIRASVWFGLAALFGVGLCGCAAVFPGNQAGGPARTDATAAELRYLIQANEASPHKLATMYHFAASDHTVAGRLHRALIQSMPGYSGYDAAAAAAWLHKLKSSGRRSVALVARLRLAAMAEQNVCHDKLHRIVNIEQRLSATAPR